MEKIFKKPLEKKKKISLKINEEFLKVVDELSILTKNSRTLIIEALIVRGMFPYFEYLKTTWKRFLDEGRYKKNKKIEEEIKNLIRNIEKIKSKHEWLNSKYYINRLSKDKNITKETKKRVMRLLQDIDLIPKKKF